MSVDWLAGPGSPLRGSVQVPGDKSISHRAVMLAAIAEGTSRITGFLEGEDTRATAAIIARLGVRVETPGPGERVVTGVGLHGLSASAEPLDCGNAGTAMRLFAGLLAGQRFGSALIGDASLSRRPMGRVLRPLTAMGATIDAAAGALPPLRIRVKNALQSIDYTQEVASAQVKSAILLAGLYATGETLVREPVPTRDYTERMLAAFGWPIDFAPGYARLGGGHRLLAANVAVPADFSSAAFFIVAACVVPGSDLVLRQVGVNPRRTGLFAALRMMGADIDSSALADVAGEPVCDLRIRHTPLRGIDLPQELVPDMIDEFPAFFVAAAAAQGTTRIQGAAELRVKESDRLAAMSAPLRQLGVFIDELPDGAIIQGGGPALAAPSKAGSPLDLGSLGDHRIAMALAVAAQIAGRSVRINDCANVATSFPGFVELARGCGFGLAAA